MIKEEKVMKDIRKNNGSGNQVDENVLEETAGGAAGDNEILIYLEAYKGGHFLGKSPRCFGSTRKARSLADLTCIEYGIPRGSFKLFKGNGAELDYGISLRDNGINAGDTVKAVSDYSETAWG